MAGIRLLPVLLLATFACQSLSQAIDPFSQDFNDDGESVAESPVFKPNEAEAKVAEETKSISNDAEKALEEPAEANEKHEDERVEVVEKIVEKPTELGEKALENPTDLAEQSIDTVTPHDTKSETITEELPAWTASKFKEAADRITKTIEEELTKVATSLMKEDSKRRKRDLFDQMTASSNDIGYDISGNGLDVDFEFLENNSVETNTESPVANSMNTQRYYYHTSNPQTTPEYYRYMPAAPEFTTEVPQETVTQSANQASLPGTSATTTQAPTTHHYNQEQSYQTPKISATTTHVPTIPQYNQEQSYKTPQISATTTQVPTPQYSQDPSYETQAPPTTQAPTLLQYYQGQSYQTPQYYEVPNTQATPAAASENQLPFYQQYPQEYFTTAAATMYPATAQGQETLVEEMTDNTESQIVEKEGMPKITHTSRKSTYKVSQSYPHESTYKQPQKMHYYFMLQ